LYLTNRQWLRRAGGICTWAAVLGTSISAFATPTPRPTAPSPSYVIPNQVVIISIDGLRPDALSERGTPYIWALSRRGSYSLSAETVTPSETLPGHSSMVSGVLPKIHKMTWDDNQYRADKGPIQVPTLFTVAKTAALQVVMVVGKEKLRHLAPANGIYVEDLRGDDAVVNEAIVRAMLPFDVLFVHLPSVDLNGHVTTWMSPSYVGQVNDTDRAVGRLLTAIPATATVILTADHGGLGANHGLEVNENMKIPWMISGPRILPNHALKVGIKTMDTAVTAAAILGLQIPGADVTGKVVSEAILPVAPMPDVIPSPAYGDDDLSY
jgi:hypothetical protein